MDKQNQDQPKQQPKKSERSPMTTGVIVLIAIVLVLLGIFFFTRSDSSDLESVAPGIEL